MLPVAKPICTGSENFISFLTPDNEVYVEEPVKFIARNEEIAVIIRNHEMVSKTFSPVNFIKNRKRKTNDPVKNPLSEKYLAGM
jgi:hypothetical protein